MDHYQVIFTVPDIISTLALANRNEIADLLFKSAWRALEKTIRTEQGYDPAALMVLHTWNQKLDAHWHVHALVPGAGPTVEGEGVKEAVAPWDGSSGSHLVDAANLRHEYRKTFLRGLKSLYRRGTLSLGGSVGNLRDEAAWDELMDQLEQKEWVSHIEPPPSELSRADHVVGYMTRYLTGGPISDHRILSANDREVTLLAREGRRTGGDRQQVPFTLSTDEFVRRWCLHIQPHQLTKTRCFGGWSNSRCKAYRLRMVSPLSEPLYETDSASPDQAQESTASLDVKTLCCESCGSESLRLSAHIAKPSWSVLLGLDSECSPWWYAESQEFEEKREWDAALGEGFYDWYVAHVLRPSESASKGSDCETPKQVQLFLPGISAPTAATSSYYSHGF